MSENKEEPSPSQENACPTCGTSIPTGAPGGLCPACILAGSQATGSEQVGCPPDAEIAKLFPEFSDVTLVGRGGMGAVYRARQPKLDREVALKILLPDLGDDPAFAERFTREARALAKLNHPNIVTVFEFGERDGIYFLIMEFIDGVNLRQAMSAGRFTPEQALAVVPEICDALSAAHTEGILHRDIKPENILLDASGRVKIVDFGIAHLLGETAPEITLTEVGAVLGSRQYMAPERIEGKGAPDHRADIYSLGVVFYEMLTGELPIGRFRPPSEKSDVTLQIDEIVHRALEKELDRRFQSAAEVKTELSGKRVKKRRSMEEVTRLAGAAAAGGGSLATRLLRVPKTVPPLTLAAVGLLAGAAVIFGGAISGDSEGLFVTSCILAGFGYLACWLALGAIRHGEISDRWQKPLQWIVVLGVALGSLWGLAVFVAEGLDDLRWNLPKFAPRPLALSWVLPLAGCFIATWLVARFARLRLQHRGLRFGMVGLVIVLSTGLFVAERLFDWRRPFAYQQNSATLELPGAEDLSEAEALAAIAEATGGQGEIYRCQWVGKGEGHHSDNLPSIGITILQRYEDGSDRYLNALVGRLHNTLPPGAVAGSSLNRDYHAMTGVETDKDYWFYEWIATSATIAGAIGILLGLLAGTIGWAGAGLFLAGTAALYLVPLPVPKELALGEPLPRLPAIQLRDHFLASSMVEQAIILRDAEALQAYLSEVEGASAEQILAELPGGSLTAMGSGGGIVSLDELQDPFSSPEHSEKHCYLKVRGAGGIGRRKTVTVAWILSETAEGLWMPRSSTSVPEIGRGDGAEADDFSPSSVPSAPSRPVANGAFWIIEDDDGA